MKRWFRRIVLCLFLGVVTTVAVAWGAWWEPSPGGGGESLSIDQATSLWRRCGGRILESDHVLAVRIPGRWLDRILVLVGRREAISNSSELRVIHTSGWPLRSMYKASEPPLRLRRIVFPRMNFEQASALDAKVAEAQQFFDETRYADAVAQFRVALKMSAELLGTEHPNSLTFMTSLARLLELEGRSTEAERLRLVSLGVHRRLFGANHPRTALNAADLGLLLADQGRYDEATALFIETLIILDQNPGIALVPMWFGFSLDALLYAAVWFMLIYCWRAHVRGVRRRRGCCPMCKYDLRGEMDQGCPECGWGREAGAES